MGGAVHQRDEMGRLNSVFHTEKAFKVSRCGFLIFIDHVEIREQEGVEDFWSFRLDQLCEGAAVRRVHWV